MMSEDDHWLLWTPPDPEQQPIPPHWDRRVARWVRSEALSPDGQLLASVQENPDDNFRLKVTQTATGHGVAETTVQPRPLSRDDCTLLWTPDGTHILLLIRIRIGSQEFRTLWGLFTSRGRLVRQQQIPADITDPRWTSDGKWLVTLRWINEPPVKTTRTDDMSHAARGIDIVVYDWKTGKARAIAGPRAQYITADDFALLP
jgi:dipeptidyl aminopeptidase/acylaminoacyl peptidase